MIRPIQFTAITKRQLDLALQAAENRDPGNGAIRLRDERTGDTFTARSYAILENWPPEFFFSRRRVETVRDFVTNPDFRNDGRPGVPRYDASVEDGELVLKDLSLA